MNNIYDPDIQKAPLHIVEFWINSNDKKVLEIAKNGDDYSFSINCAAYLDDKFLSNVSLAPNNYIVCTVLSTDKTQKYLNQQYIDFDLENSIVPFEFKVKLPASEISFSDIRIQLSYVTSVEPHAGITESLRAGRFFDTKIPVNKESN